MEYTSVSMQGIGAEYVTFYPGSALTLHYPCMLEDNNTVRNCTSGKDFMGVITAARGDLVTVQTKGFVTLRYNGDTAPTVGYCKLAGNGAGGVAVNANGQTYLVTQVDTTEHTVGLFL